MLIELFMNMKIQKGLNLHSSMHKKRSDKEYWYKCLKPNCQSSFEFQHDLDRHMKIHNNELDTCQYCPYRYTKDVQYRDHLNKHFGLKDYKCQDCGLKFSTKNGLASHSALHEGIIYCCLICKTYEISQKQSMQFHMRSKHSDLLGKNMNWDLIEKYVKLK